jgi:hypothetical protein
MNVVAQLPDVNPVLPVRTITGRYLAHAKHTREQWAFLGAELHLGSLRPVDLTVIQAAFLAHGVHPSAVHLALQHIGDRKAIEAGSMSLVPHKSVLALPAPKTAEARVAEVVAEFGLVATCGAIEMVAGRIAA